MTDTELLDNLRSLTAGLSWMSESDYPFDMLLWNDLCAIAPEELKARTGHSPDTPVEVMELDRFFKQAVKEQDWHNEEEKAEVRRYQALVEALKQNLKDIQVYRVGECEIDIYIVGVTASGCLMGLSTKAVET